MAGNKHPIPIAIVDRPRIAFNIFYSLQGREFAHKENPDAVCEGSAEARSALCTAIGEARERKVTLFRADAEKCRPQRPPASSRNALLWTTTKRPPMHEEWVELLVDRRDGLYLHLRPHGRLRWPRRSTASLCKDAALPHHVATRGNGPAVPCSNPMSGRMIRRRALATGIKTEIGCHTFRATGITAYFKNGGWLEIAHQTAAHESVAHDPQTWPISGNSNVLLC
jgi:hypothetical protein